MSYRSLMNRRIRVYHPPGTRTTKGDYTDGYTPAMAEPTSPNARPDDSFAGRLQDGGAGQEQAAARRWFLLPDVPAAERQALEVLDGPEAGNPLKIVSVTHVSDRRGVHHVEVNVEAAAEVRLP